MGTVGPPELAALAGTVPRSALLLALSLLVLCLPLPAVKPRSHLQVALSQQTAAAPTHSARERLLVYLNLDACILPQVLCEGVHTQVHQVHIRVNCRHD